IFTGILILFTQPLFAAEVNLISAEEVALNFIIYLDENHTIRETESLEESSQTVGYIVHLAPQGYILVSGDTIRVPVKAYSLTSNFDSLPPAYVKVLLNELQLPSSFPPPITTTSSSTTSKSASSRTSSVTQPEDINKPYWDFLTQTHIASRKSLRSYTPDTFLLTTKWDQGYPYNKFNPKLGNELTVTGCVQTAVAQVMRYHSYPSSGSGVFRHIWNGQTLTAVMNRPFNWNAMPNSVDGTVPQYQQDEVATLMRDLGVLNEAEFGIDGTSAAFYYDEFERAFGYAPVSNMESSNSNFFTTIKNEINNRRPVLLAMPGHLTVADGYSSDPSGKKIHVNLGWSGASDDYYYLDQTILTEQYSFAPNHTIYYNIKPCQGGECNPYIPGTSGNPPVIASNLNDMVIESTDTIENDTIRIEAYDPDGDTVTLSAISSCNNLKSILNGNLLTLTPTASNIFCELTISAQSYDGSAEKTFRVLVIEDMIYIGTQYDIGGQFANGTEIDEYKAYLEGYTTISGDRGSSNQAFFIWVKDKNGNTVISASDNPVSGTLTAGLYTIFASLENPFTNYYYTYYAASSGYILTVTGNSLSATVSDLAESMGIELTDDSSTPDIAPTAETGNASSITTNSAILNGTINPNGVATTFYFEYGKSTSYGSKTTLQNAGSGTSSLPVTAELTAALSNLSADTIYHFRLVTTNSAGTTNGSDQTFTTAKLNLPESVTSYKILTTQSHSLTIQYGEYIKV
ncbi:MAG: C10 family peptidase, partial [Desulfamplus sp.]|nr:C10 family peptidase [Desulfamplus sp.]